MKNSDVGLLIVRLAIGVMFVLHGIPKILAGSDTWAGLAQAVFGPDVLPSFLEYAMGLSAGVVEIAGGILLASGIFYRPALILLIGVMAAAIKVKFGDVTGFSDFAFHMGYPTVMFFTFIGLFFIGAGRFRLRLPLRSKA
jgi:putative oxidoreductase